MAQDRVVMAFRKRLGKRGYQNIRIYQTLKLGVYLVLALEPLAGVGVQREMDLQDMYEWR